MASTRYFGLTAFGAEGKISDAGYKFSNRDRITIDALLYTLFTHDHRSTENALAGLQPPSQPPALTLSASGGDDRGRQDLHLPDQLP